MIKVRPKHENGLVLLRPSNTPGFVPSYPSRDEFDALLARVTELEKRYQNGNASVTPVTKRGNGNALTPAAKQRAYRERKKANG